MVLTNRMRRAVRLILLGGALLATYAGSAALSARIALRLREVTVPALIGQPVDGASAAVADRGLALRVDESRRADPKIAAGPVTLAFTDIFTLLFYFGIAAWLL